MSTNPWEMGNKKHAPSFWLMYGFYKWTYKDIYMYKNKQTYIYAYLKEKYLDATVFLSPTNWHAEYRLNYKNKFSDTYEKDKRTFLYGQLQAFMMVYYVKWSMPALNIWLHHPSNFRVKVIRLLLLNLRYAV